MRSLIVVSVAALAFPIMMLAQEAAPSAPAEGMGTHSLVIAGQPYSVVEKITTIRPLADGTRITHQVEEQKWRDEQGRFRTQSAEIEANGTIVFHRAEIMDPTARTLTILLLDKKTAMVVHLPEKGDHPRPEPANGVNPRLLARPGVKVTEQPLPAKMIAGESVTGTRVTRTRPVGTVGNDHVLVSTSDRYEDPDLQILLYSSMNDPRESMVREVTSLDRNTPDPTIFQVPQDFTVKDISFHGNRPMGEDGPQP